LLEQEQQDYVLMATEGLSKSAVGIIRIKPEEGLVGLVGQREEPINVEDAQSHPRFKLFPQADEEAYYGFLGAPIIHQRKVLGVIAVQQTESRLFCQDEIISRDVSGTNCLRNCSCQSERATDHWPKGQAERG
jgi:phosphotransferase system enzyme I (PtsP)